MIVEGAYADMVVIKGDSFEDITIFSKPDECLNLFIKDDVIYKRTLSIM